MGYTPSFTPEYEGGWEDLPLETTPITADALNNYDEAVENIEDYLASDNSQANLADAYDETATYEAGDYVIYGGDLYKCLEDIDEPEEWDSTKWESCLITDEMGHGGGGSDVSITPTLSTGTKIADFEIDGESGSLYAPTGGGGASALEDLTDVNLTSLADGQIIKWDETSQKWINADEIGGGSGVFPNFSDVIQPQTTISTSATYTATEDCFVQYSFIIPASTASSILTSNNDVLFNMFSGSQLTAYDGIMFIHKGTTITLTGGSSGSSVSKYTVYGVISTGGKAEHYSTDEEVIGTFMGETLYRKVIPITANWDFTANTWVKSNIPQGDIKAIVNGRLEIFYQNAHSLHFIQLGFVDNMIAGNSFRQFSATANGANLILEYTKTS